MKSETYATGDVIKLSEFEKEKIGPLLKLVDIWRVAHFESAKGLEGATKVLWEALWELFPELKDFQLYIDNNEGTISVGPSTLPPDMT